MNFLDRSDQMPERLESERLALELVSVQWLDEIMAEIRGNVAKYFVNFADKNELQTWINENRRLFGRGEKLEMVMLRKTDGEFLGMVSIRNIGIAPEIGVWVKVSAQGQGLAKEALDGLLSWYRIKNGVQEKVKYVVEKGNSASVALAQKMGMTYIQDIADEGQIVYQEYLI